MYKLWAAIKKDMLILLRDRVGLALMFIMPVILALLITSVQNSTFELVNDNKIGLIIYNADTGKASQELQTALEKAGLFSIQHISEMPASGTLSDNLDAQTALVGLAVPSSYSSDIQHKAEQVAADALGDLLESGDSTKTDYPASQPVKVYYHPVLQASFRKSIQGALSSSLQLVQSRHIVNQLYVSVNDSPAPDSLEEQISNNQTPLEEGSVAKNGTRIIPNATQHNIPAWTIFAMFFIVISLGSSIVREKTSGSFMRLRTLPTSLRLALFSKQIAYIAITLVQALVIFSIGIYVFPLIGLPGLELPSSITGLLIVTLLCGICASSFALCVGVYAKTQEQANGVGAVSIVLLAAIGGLMVPAFAMPTGFQYIMKLSPLHWCLEAYYSLFLEQGNLSDIFVNIIPLTLITVILQVVALAGLRKKGMA